MVATQKDPLQDHETDTSSLQTNVEQVVATQKDPLQDHETDASSLQTTVEQVPAEDKGALQDHEKDTSSSKTNVEQVVAEQKGPLKDNELSTTKKKKKKKKVTTISMNLYICDKLLVLIRSPRFNRKAAVQTRQRLRSTLVFIQIYDQERYATCALYY